LEAQNQQEKQMFNRPHIQQRKRKVMIKKVVSCWEETTLVTCALATVLVRHSGEMQ
jgi:hypothetical protein